MTTRLSGKSALITGSTSNIGKAIALALAAEGAHVVVSGRDQARGAEVVAEIESLGGLATFIAADLNGSQASSHQLATEAVAAVGGRLDILVNNAGVFPPARTLDADEATFDLIYGVNVKAPYFLTQAVVPAMAEAGGGVIINLGSWVVKLGLGSGALYASSKGALETLTRAWSSEFAAQNIRVNAISPGVILDGGHDPASPVAPFMAGTPAGVIGSPEAVAQAAVYLASDEASFVHGIVLDVDGGRANVAVVAS
ncbi:SDR family NAD(P)-dependent oxidoreductase [Aeromicrobium sp. UC242_57]|uniref:SDR family NAD(P)-dependent oxidoreductase n=1 Tax=Aeromicrobium sp. UC242_57 TaxID=3374624 RepID=UPI0037B761E5